MVSKEWNTSFRYMRERLMDTIEGRSTQRVSIRVWTRDVETCSWSKKRTQRKWMYSKRVTRGSSNLLPTKWRIWWSTWVQIWVKTQSESWRVWILELDSTKTDFTNSSDVQNSINCFPYNIHIPLIFIYNILFWWGCHSLQMGYFLWENMEEIWRGRCPR